MVDTPESSWPPVPGDFLVGNPELPVAICTLGKKLEINSEYAIVGTCKTENIGIERIIVNVVSNSSIRYLILAGPEIPGHLTGQSLRALYNNGVDQETKRIIDAKGAIPYIENVPLSAVDRFRDQVELIDMLNILDVQQIESRNTELNNNNIDIYPKDAIWVEFKVKSKRKAQVLSSSGITILPELGMSLNPFTSVISGQSLGAIVSTHPSYVVVRVKETPDNGYTLTGQET